MLNEISEEVLKKYLVASEELPKDHPGIHGLWQQLNESFKAKNPIAVLEYAADLIGVGCRDAKMFYFIAWAHYRLFEFNRAKRWIEFALKIYPKDIELKLLMVEILIIEQNSTEAIDLLSNITVENLDDDNRKKIAELMSKSTSQPVSTFFRRLLN